MKGSERVMRFRKLLRDLVCCSFFWAFGRLSQSKDMSHAWKQSSLSLDERCALRQVAPWQILNPIRLYLQPRSVAVVCLTWPSGLRRCAKKRERERERQKAKIRIDTKKHVRVQTLWAA